MFSLCAGCPGNKKNSSELSMVSSPASSQSTPLSSPAVIVQDSSEADMGTRLPKLTMTNSPCDVSSMGTCQEQSNESSLLESPTFLSASGDPSTSSTDMPIPEENLQPPLGCPMLPDLGDDSLEAFLRQEDFTASSLGGGPLYLGPGEEWDTSVLSSFDTHLPTAQTYPPQFTNHPASSSQAYHPMFTTALPMQETWSQGPVTYSSYPYDPHHPVTTSAQ